MTMETWTDRQRKEAHRGALPILVRLRHLWHRARMDDSARDAYEEGLWWYPLQAQDVRLQCPEVPERVALACAAILSPANNWAALKERLPAFIGAAIDGDPLPAFPTYGRQRAVAAALVAWSSTLLDEPSDAGIERFV